MTNYPEGSMQGSGINSQDTTQETTCPNCNHTWEDDFITDDWGNIDTVITCPTCQEQVTVSTSIDIRYR